MNQEHTSLRVGAVVLAAAVLLRLISGGALEKIGALLAQPKVVAALMYLETGRVVRIPDTMTYPAESPAPLSTAPPVIQAPELPPATPVFTQNDLDHIEMDYGCDYAPDLAALLTQPLRWDLAGGEARVLILHTHTTESYTPSPGEIYEESSEYRTLDDTYNMISIGDAVAQKLESAGIGVIHDRDFHDYPSYNGSYADARASIEAILADNPGICLILDLHRDAADVGDGQLDTSARINGQESAQLMLVVGTDAGGLYHPHWQENLALALKLQAQLERMHPGLCRPIDLRAQRFNADESPGALLIEMGAAGNTHEEALLAADVLAEGIIALAKGANITEDSTTPADGPLP